MTTKLFITRSPSRRRSGSFPLCERGRRHRGRPWFVVLPLENVVVQVDDGVRRDTAQLRRGVDGVGSVRVEHFQLLSREGREEFSAVCDVALRREVVEWCKWMVTKPLQSDGIAISKRLRSDGKAISEQLQGDGKAIGKR
jgi:hypothetical protein